jgi:uncharacterized protein
MTTTIAGHGGAADWWIRPEATTRRMPTPGPAGRRIKVAIVGGFGVGKTTFVAAASDIPAATTEVPLLGAGCDGGDCASVPAKTSTTTVVDVGRVTLAPALTLVLFGTCGLARFRFTLTDVCRGAAGAIVLVDTRGRHLADGFGCLDFVERCGLPHLIAINEFDGDEHHRPTAVRDALAINPSVPVVACDARSHAATRNVLAAFAAHVLDRRPPPAHAPVR